MKAGDISESHGKILAGLPLEKQYFFAEACVEKQWSMRALSEAIKLTTFNHKESLEKNCKKDVDIMRLEREMGDRFGHEIKFYLEKDKSGHVKINFCSLDELDSILHKLKKIV